MSGFREYMHIEKFGTINGKTLKALTIQKIKQLKPELF